MKRKFITKKFKPNKKLKFVFLFIMFIIGMYVSYRNLEKSKIEISDKELVNLVVNNSFNILNHYLNY